MGSRARSSFKPTASGAARRRLAGCVAFVAAALGLAGFGGSALADQPVRILAFGDSLTAGTGLNPDEIFPARLQARLKADGIDAVVLNGGFFGDTTGGGRARLKWSLKDKPQYAIVELGVNDALRGVAPSVAEANLDTILARLRDAHVKVLLAGMRAPANWGREYQVAFEAIYPRLAAKYDVPLYPFFPDDVAADSALTSGGDLHPTAHGVETVVARIAPAVERLIGPGQPGG